MNACRSAWTSVLIAGAALSWAAPVAAQTVYRCGPDGRSYSHQPCVEGRALQADDARTPSQQTQAQAAVGREAAAARALEQDRLRGEALAARTGPAGFKTAPLKRAEGPRIASKKPSKASKKTVKRAVKRAPAKALGPRPENV